MHVNFYGKPTLYILSRYFKTDNKGHKEAFLGKGKSGGKSDCILLLTTSKSCILDF